jgi:hypothetical protein
MSEDPSKQIDLSLSNLVARGLDLAGVSNALHSTLACPFIELVFKERSAFKSPKQTKSLSVTEMVRW